MTECIECHQPVLVEVEGGDPLCPKCRRRHHNRATTRTERIDTRVRPSVIEAIDAARGTWSRAEYVRRALGLAKIHRLRGPS